MDLAYGEIPHNPLEDFDSVLDAVYAPLLKAQEDWGHCKSSASDELLESMRLDGGQERSLSLSAAEDSEGKPRKNRSATSRTHRLRPAPRQSRQKLCKFSAGP